MEITYNPDTGHIYLDDEARLASGFGSPVTYPEGYDECSTKHEIDSARLLEMKSADDDDLTLAERGYVPMLQRRVAIQMRILGAVASHHSEEISEANEASVIAGFEDLLKRKSD